MKSLGLKITCPELFDEAIAGALNNVPYALIAVLKGQPGLCLTFHEEDFIVETNWYTTTTEQQLIINILNTR